MEDTKPVERTVERCREWQHEGKPDCPRREKPVYTKPDALPDPCGVTRDGYDPWACGSGDWRSRGIVLRDGKKNVIAREKGDV